MKMNRLYKTRPVDGFNNCETVRPIRRENIGDAEWLVVVIVAAVAPQTEAKNAAVRYRIQHVDDPDRGIDGA